MIEIKEIHSKKELKAFVKFPFKIYKNSPYWIPPIISQELETFNKKVNPIFKDAEARFFLAIKNGHIVGRIATIINWLEVNKQNEKKMRFGWFDFIDDLEVSKALLNKVESIGKDKELEFAEGPVGFSNLDKVGVISDGYDRIARMITWYNHPYYIKHYEAHGYAVEKSYVESKFYFKDVHPDNFAKASQLIRRRYKLKTLNFTEVKEVMHYADAMFDLFNETYSSLSSFVEITEPQKAYFKKKFISFVNPEYIKFVINDDNKLIAFAIVMPGYAEAIQKTKGKLFPFGFTHILNAKKNSKDAVFYLIGVLPEYQNKGVHALIFEEFYKVMVDKKIENLYRTPELESNEAIHKIWKHFNPKIYRRRKTYRKNL